jgi:hypothetical protein
MVRMKLSKDEFDPKKLDVKVEKSTFKRYRGEIPPNGTILIFRVTRMWWTQSKAGDSQIYLLAFAEQNEGKLAKYNGLPIREYLTFNPDAAFRYQNFLHNFGLTTRDIYNRMDVQPEPDNIGDIINSIGPWVVGSDDALCRVALVRDRYDPDELKAKVDKEGWLPLEDEDELDDDVDDDDVDDEEDDEEEEQPARPTRTRGAARTRQATPSARGRRRGDPDEDEDEDDEYDDDVEDDEEDDVDGEEQEAEAEAEAEDQEEAEEAEPPARTRRGRTARASATSTRPAARATSRGSGRTQRTAPADGARRGSRTTATRESTRARRIKEDDPPF